MIAFRGDIDALPIQEVTGLDFASEVPGVTHACGHDMHTTVVLGLAVALAAFVDAHEPDALGVRVRFIFQPAEEVMDGGATEVIATGALNGVSQIFALHCEPKLRSGKWGCEWVRSQARPMLWKSYCGVKPHFASASDQRFGFRCGAGSDSTAFAIYPSRRSPQWHRGDVRGN